MAEYEKSLMGIILQTATMFAKQKMNPFFNSALALAVTTNVVVAVAIHKSKDEVGAICLLRMVEINFTAYN